MSTITITFKDAPSVTFKDCMGGGPAGDKLFGVHQRDDIQRLFHIDTIDDISIEPDMADKMGLTAAGVKGRSRGKG